MENVPHWTGVAIGVLPAVIFLCFIKGNEPWRISTLLAGVALVLLATLMLGLMTDFGPVYDLLQKQGVVDEGTTKTAKGHIGLWAFMFPAVSGAIGANLITAWFLSKKP